MELGGIVLERLTHVTTGERARIVHHDVPGSSGEFAQTLGRHAVEVSLRGIFYGPGAVEDMSTLRAAYLEQAPVDFFTESVGEGYFTQVLISRLEISQRAGYLDQFDFACDVVEYVEPPEPTLVDPLAALDTGLLEDAAGFVDDVQNALEQVSQLADLLNTPAFGNPAESLPGIESGYVQAASQGAAVLAEIRDLF